MAERLVVISDMWGAKKGLWITSYLGYLQQHFDIVFYDCQQLADINLIVDTEKNIHNEFVNGGIDTAVAHLLNKEKEQKPSRYLAFSTGGTIAWKAALKGLPVKSLYAVSATRIRKETEDINCERTLVYGANDSFRPDQDWAKKINTKMEVIPGFGHDLYSDEKMIKKVCKDLLQEVIKKQFQD